MTLEQRLQALAVAIGTDVKKLKGFINGNVADLGALQTTAKNNLIAAVNEVRQLALDAANAGGASLNDAATNQTEGWTSQKITDFVLAQISSVLGPDAPALLNTIDEIAAALGDDPNAISSIMTSLANRLRFDAAQTLSAAEKAQGCTNLGAASLVNTGNLDADLVSTYNTAKA